MEKEARKLYKKTRDAVNKARRSYVCRPLKDVIQQYRECKTLEEERALVKKESAHIRDLFREGDTAFRRRNIQKLMFFHMNGYAVDFGHLECLKLAASAKFADKRVGYLGILVLLDENAELLMLITNAIKMDLAPANDPAVIALALGVLADISSAEMLHDLEPDIATLMLDSNSNLAKRAILVADRAVRKVPELVDAFAPHLPALLSSGHAPSVYLAACALLMSVCQNASGEAALSGEQRATCASALLKLIAHTLDVARDADVDAGAVPNPTLLVRAIKALRFVFGSEAAVAELQEPSDALRGLAQTALESLVRVATRLNEDQQQQLHLQKTSTKAAGASAAVLYETMRSLRVLGVRYVGVLDSSLRELVRRTMMALLERFMSSKEQNMRYIGLQELRLSVPLLNSSAVSQHETAVVECLKHVDVSMRARAVDLLYVMCAIQPQHAPRYIDELLQYLPRCNVDDQPSLSLKIAALVEGYYNSSRDELKKLNAMLDMLRETDARMPERLVSLFLAMLSRASERCRQEAVAQLVAQALLCKTEPNSGASRKLRQLRVAAYVAGEYGATATKVDFETSGASSAQLSAEALVRALDSVLESVRLDEGDAPYAPLSAHSGLRGEIGAVRLNALLAVMKLATRAGGTSHVVTQARTVVLRFCNHSDLETQQRACEYSALLLPEQSAARAKLFAPMPPLDYEARRAKVLSDVAAEMNTDAANPQAGAGSSNAVRLAAIGGGSSGGNLLLELDDDVAESAQSASMHQLPPPLPIVGAAAPVLPEFDLLALAAPPQASKTQESVALQSSAADPLADLFGAGDARASGAFVDLNSARDAAASAASSAQHSSDPFDLLGLTSVPNAPTRDTQKAGNTPNVPSALNAAAAAAPRLSEEISVWNSKDASFAVVLKVKPRDRKLDAAAAASEPLRALFVFSNSSRTDTLERFELQLAVPKYIQLELMPASASRLAPGQKAEQRVSLLNTMRAQGKSTQFRFRLEYNYVGQSSVTEQGALRDLND